MIKFEHYKKVDEMVKEAIDKDDMDTVEYLQDILSFMMGYLKTDYVEWKKLTKYIRQEIQVVKEELEG